MKLSMITVCKNNLGELKRTSQSVVAQSYPNIEYLIVDGASKDGTRDYLCELEKQCDVTWISEEDSGIYHAMNKGISLASGDILTFINAGDIYISSEIIDSVVADIGDSPDYVLYSGNMISVAPDGSRFHCFKIENIDYDMTQMYLRGLAHPSTFYRKELFELVGHFDERFRISGDLDLHMRCMREGIGAKKLMRYIALFQEGGISYSKIHEGLREEEMLRIRRKYGITIPEGDILGSLRASFQQILRKINNLNILNVFSK